MKTEFAPLEDPPPAIPEFPVLQDYVEDVTSKTHPQPFEINCTDKTFADKCT